MPTMWPTQLFTAAMLMGADAVPEGSARILSYNGSPSFDGTGHLEVFQAGNMDARLPRRLLNGLSICCVCFHGLRGCDCCKGAGLP